MRLLRIIDQCDNGFGWYESYNGDFNIQVIYINPSIFLAYENDPNKIDTIPI